MTSRRSTGSALQLTSLAGAAAIALLITFAFLCAAAFVYVLQHYGPVEALPSPAPRCSFVVTLVAIARLHGAQARDAAARRRRPRRRAKSAAATMFADLGH